MVGLCAESVSESARAKSGTHDDEVTRRSSTLGHSGHIVRRYRARLKRTESFHQITVAANNVSVGGGTERRDSSLRSAQHIPEVERLRMSAIVVAQRIVRRR